MALETGIFLSQAIWLWRVRHVRREAKKLGMTYDEYMNAHPSKKLARTESSETVVDIEAGNDDNQQRSKSCASHLAENITSQSIQPSIITATEEKLTIPEKVASSNGRRG